MFISIKTNPPPDGAQVLVKLDDGTREKECYAVARYSSEIGFIPANIKMVDDDEDPFDPYATSFFGEYEFIHQVIAWKSIE